MAEIQIRRATIEDLEAVLDLWDEMMELHARLDARFQPEVNARELFGETLREWMVDDSRRVLVATADGQVMGYTIGVVAENPPIFKMRYYGHVSDICVAPEWRRQGVGCRLFAALRKWFRQHGLMVVQLHVAAFNPSSQTFWRQMGFEDYMHRMWSDI